MANPIPSSSIKTPLAFEEVLSTTDRPINFTAFFLPGVMGRGSYWVPFSTSLASSLASFSPPSDWKMICVDLRNHGRSTRIENLLPPHDMINAANDLANLAKSQACDWPDVVIGHSMAANVALQYAKSCANGDYGDSAKLPKQIWLLDSVPQREDGLAVGTELLLKFLQGLPSTIPSREWLVEHMDELGIPNYITKWISSNLETFGENASWSFNLEGCIEMFKSYRELDYWPVLEQPPKGMEIIIVRAEKTDVWDEDIVRKLDHLAQRKDDGTMGKVSVQFLANSGHWVHKDKPKGLLEILTAKMASLV